MTILPRGFVDKPLAHRGLHGVGRPENSMAAFLAAHDAGYGIELDLQLSADGHAVVFHDKTLGRMTALDGPVLARSLDELQRTTLAGSQECIPSLEEVLARIAGRTPVLIEMKDQSGRLAGADGHFETSVAHAVNRHPKNAAVMSFNPDSIAAMRDLAPDVPRGLTTENFGRAFWPGVPAETISRLTGIPDYERVGATFISHHRRHLDMPRVEDLKSAGATILCWTVRSNDEEEAARKTADNVTFEGYAAQTPA